MFSFLETVCQQGQQSNDTVQTTSPSKQKSSFNLKRPPATVSQQRRMKSMIQPSQMSPNQLCEVFQEQAAVLQLSGTFFSPVDLKRNEISTSSERRSKSSSQRTKFLNYSQETTEVRSNKQKMKTLEFGVSPYQSQFFPSKTHSSHFQASHDSTLSESTLQSSSLKGKESLPFSKQLSQKSLVFPENRNSLHSSTIHGSVEDSAAFSDKKIIRKTPSISDIKKFTLNIRASETEIKKLQVNRQTIPNPFQAEEPIQPSNKQQSIDVIYTKNEDDDGKLGEQKLQLSSSQIHRRYNSEKLGYKAVATRKQVALDGKTSPNTIFQPISSGVSQQLLRSPATQQYFNKKPFPVINQKIDSHEQTINKSIKDFFSSGIPESCELNVLNSNNSGLMKYQGTSSPNQKINNVKHVYNALTRLGVSSSTRNSKLFIKEKQLTSSTSANPTTSPQVNPKRFIKSFSVAQMKASKQFIKSLHSPRDTQCNNQDNLIQNESDISENERIQKGIPKKDQEESSTKLVLTASSSANSTTQSTPESNLSQILVPSFKLHSSHTFLDKQLKSTFTPIKIQQVVSSFAVKTKPGSQPNKPIKTNQDAYIVFPSFCCSVNKYLFGICDGHGQNGHHVSAFIRKNLPINFEAYLKLSGNDEDFNIVTRCIMSAFHKTSQDLLNSEINTELSGSTCVVIFFNQNKMWWANLGDSRAIYARSSSSAREDTYLDFSISIDQKPDNEHEKKRIIENGGAVEPYRDCFGKQQGPYRVWVKYESMPGLAMSRSFGDQLARTVTIDIKWKIIHFVFDQVGVISEPEVGYFEISEEDKFIVIASDGVWEFLSNKVVVNIVVPYYLKNDPVGACEQLVLESTAAWKKKEYSVDDITAIVIFLNKNSSRFEIQEQYQSSSSGKRFQRTNKSEIIFS